MDSFVRKLSAGAVAAASFFGIALAWAQHARADQVTQKIEINAAPDKVWAEIGDFCGIKNWHPAIASCEADRSGKRPVRTLITKDGAKIIEQEISRNEMAHAYSYRIVESPLPVEKYHSTLKVLGLGDHKSEIVWSGEFGAKGTPAEADKIIAGIYSGGLEGLKKEVESVK